MKLESFEMRDALAASDWDRATLILCRHFKISIRKTPRVLFDKQDDRAIVALSCGSETYRWSSDRGFSKYAYSWIAEYEIRIGEKWWNSNA